MISSSAHRYPYRAVFALVLGLSTLAGGCKRRTTSESTPSDASASEMQGAAPASQQAGSDSTPPAPDSTSTTPAPARGSDASASSASPSAASPSSAESPPPTLSKEDERRYLAALGTGRRATSSEDFSVAVAAFTRALQSKPNDGRAFAERGYAHLLAGRLEAADSDFQRALDHAESFDVIAQTIHNRGLLEEKLGHTEEAAEFERLHQRLGHLAGIPHDTARRYDRLVRRIADGGVKKDWQAVLAAIVERFEKEGRTYPSRPAPDASEQEVRSHLKISAGADGPLWLIDMSEVADGGSWHVVGRRSDGDLALYLDVAERMFGRCGLGPERLQAKPGLRRLVVENDVESMPIAGPCFDKDGNVISCDSDAVESQMSGCGESRNGYVFLLFDFERPEAYFAYDDPMDFDRPDVFEPRYEVIPQVGGAWVVGNGMNRFLPE